MVEFHNAPTKGLIGRPFQPPGIASDTGRDRGQGHPGGAIGRRSAGTRLFTYRRRAFVYFVLVIGKESRSRSHDTLV